MSEHQCDFKLVPIKMSHFIEVFSAKFYDFKVFRKFSKWKTWIFTLKFLELKFLAIQILYSNSSYLIWMYGFRYYPKGIFLWATYEVTISQVAFSQLYSFLSCNFPQVRLGLPRRGRLQCGPSTGARSG